MSRGEETETIYGVENTVSLSLQCFARVKERYDSCGGNRSPSLIVTKEQTNNAYRRLLRRGIKPRFITEITETNIEYCKELIKIVHELRHLEGIKCNFAVSESDYVATAVEEQGGLIPQLIHSNARAMIEQQQYFFQTLWDKAIPSKIRIKEIEEGIRPEKTEVIYGLENTLRVSLECFARVRERLDSCCDHTMPSVIISNEPIRNAAIPIVKRGVKPRFITEITKQNINYCKELIKIGHEVRHIDNAKGNFAISERDYIANSAQEVASPLTQLIHSNVGAIVEQQQYIFETLWSKAIPAKQRFKEIEQGAKIEFIETIRDPYEIQKLGIDLIKRAEEEVLILFSTANAFYSQAKSGALELLKEAASQRGVKIRVLVPADDNNKTIIITATETIQQLKEIGIDIQQIKKEGKLDRLQNSLTLLIVDQSVCLTVELDEDMEETSNESIGLATYSNSESTVFAYTSIFEDLSMHAER